MAGGVLILGGRDSPGGQAVRDALQQSLAETHGEVPDGRSRVGAVVGPDDFTCAGVIRSLNAGPQPNAQAHRMALARSALIETVVVVLPATAAEWFAVGFLFALRRYGSVRLALIVPPGELAAPLELPLVAADAGLVTDSADQVSAWIQGRLFQGLLPDKPRRVNVTGPEHDPREH